MRETIPAPQGLSLVTTRYGFAYWGTRRRSSRVVAVNLWAPAGVKLEKCPSFGMACAPLKLVALNEFGLYEAGMLNELAPNFEWPTVSLSLKAEG